MEVIKRKILLEDSIDRSNDSNTWGTITASTFYLNILLTQNVDDMGLFIDSEFIPQEKVSGAVDYSMLISKLNTLGYTFPFMVGAMPQTLTNVGGTDKVVLRLPESKESDYYVFGNLPITGNTDSKIEDVKSYKASNQFRINFNTATETYVNYNNLTVVGVDRIKSMGEPKIYVFDTENDVNLGTNNQTTGIQYKDYSGSTTIMINGVNKATPITSFRFIGEGWNDTNISLSALTKEEYLFGIISPPEVQSDVFIDRGATSVLDMHLRLSEIGNISELTRYGNGFYKLNKQ
jgi:hypothetical protein